MKKRKEDESMENNKGFKALAIIALCVSIIGVSVAFAALTQDLTIEGDGVVNPATWDVHFANITEPVLVKEAAVESNPEINGTGKIINYDFIFKAPGDSISFTFDMVNAGDLDAIITSITGADMTGWTFEAIKEEEGNYVADDRASATADIALVRRDLQFSLVYTDGGAAPAVDNELTAGGAEGTKNVTLTVTYDENANEFPSGLVRINPSDIVFTYTQNNS